MQVTGEAELPSHSFHLNIYAGALRHAKCHHLSLDVTAMHRLSGAKS